MKVENYGELISKVIGKPLLAYVEFGCYQGNYIAVLDSGVDIELWKGGYGSCSGCDWLQAEMDWDTYEIPDEKAREYMGSDTPFATIPKETVLRVDEETFTEMLPANIRGDIYEFEPVRFFEEIKKSLS